MSSTRIRAGRIAAATALGASALSFAGPAQADAAVSYSCRASAVTAQLAGASRLDPIRAGDDAAACSSAVAGLPNAAEAVGLGGGLKARTAYASVASGGARPVTARPAATAGIEGLSVAVLGPGGLQVGLARSSVSAVCSAGRPTFTGTSQVGSVTLAGRPLVIDGVVQPITTALTQALGAVVSVQLNEQVGLPGGGRAVRAAHIRVLPVGGGTALADVIVAESRLGANGAVCDASQPPNGGGGGGGGGGNGGGGNGGGSGGGGNGGGSDTSGICPRGSVFDAGRKLCVIAVPGSRTAANPAGDLTGRGAVVVGKPYQGPRGGTVVSLATARKRYKSPCLRGRGLKYVVVGRRRGDRITGTNRADRILGLRGNDRIDGGRGGDCIDGGRGGDKMTGGQGNDRVFGHGGNDAVNGDSGNDRLYGGRGNDSSNAGYGRDRVFGGPGRDAINIATAGPRQIAYGGKGYDIVRLNPEDRAHGAERVHKVIRVKG